MSPQLLLSFFILCSALPTIISPQFYSTDSRQFSSRILSQKIIDKENKKVEKIIKHKTYFQSYHFSLKSEEKFIEFYLDPWAEEQIEGYISVMWKQKNVFLLGNILQSQKLRLQIYENTKRILKKSFYTKVSFRFYAKQDKLYRMRISHKNQSPLVSKLVTLHVEYFFELFEQRQDIKDSVQFEQNKKSRQKEFIESDNNIVVSQQFELWTISQRLRQFLINMKVNCFINKCPQLLINQAQTKHLAEYSVQKFIQDSVDIYWQYELFECGLLILCTIVQILLINRLLNSNRILV